MFSSNVLVGTNPTGLCYTLRKKQQAFIKDQKLGLDVLSFICPRKHKTIRLPSLLQKVQCVLLHFSGFTMAEVSHIISKCYFCRMQLQLFLSLPFPPRILSPSGI